MFISLQDLCESMLKRGYGYCSFQKEMMTPVTEQGLQFSLIEEAGFFDDCTELDPQWYEGMHKQLSTCHLIFAKFDESSLQAKKGAMVTPAKTVVAWDFGAMSDVEVYRNVGSYQYDAEPVASAAEFYRAPDHCNVM